MNERLVLRRIPREDYKSVLPLATRLREVDKRELLDATGMDTVKDVLLHSMLTSEAVNGLYYDGELEGVYGYALTEASFIGEIAVPWFVGTAKINTFGLSFTKEAMYFLRELSRNNPNILNYVAVYNTKAIKWLERIGFTVCYEESTLLETDVEFYPFYYVAT